MYVLTEFYPLLVDLNSIVSNELAEGIELIIPSTDELATNIVVHIISLALLKGVD